ncbi:MAG TPA: hypothetical protein VJ698_18275 [Noviherbaspirillum sp.]|uniref:hypothetical protein n=1 Tax=Noviherbaspirillum sp. TaxID=1926288 RepID=UPI002B47CCDB|nr:hypothetical protein [Noviherbaspirillum sp.]HJV87421.1 hypothetical protein [Noviherbaspirillum sp.]
MAKDAIARIVDRQVAPCFLGVLGVLAREEPTSLHPHIPLASREKGSGDRNAIASSPLQASGDTEEGEYFVRVRAAGRAHAASARRSTGTMTMQGMYQALRQRKSGK